EGTGIIPWVPDVLTDESDEEISWKSSDEDDDDEIDERGDDQEDDDDQDDDDQVDNDDDQDTDNDSDDFVHPNKEGQDAEDDDEELYGDININLEGRDVQMTNVHTTQECEDTHVTLTLVNLDGQQQSLSVSSQFVTSMLNLSPDACIDSFFESTPWVDVQALTTVVPLILTALTLPPPTIPTISPPTTAASTFLQDLLNVGSLFGFDHHLNTLKANFAEFVQINQFAGAVSYIPMIVERYMDEQMNEAVLNLYKALVDAYECDKIILDTYGDTVTLKRRRDDADKDEEPSVGSDRWSKRRREGKEPESTSAPKEQATKTTGKSTQGSKSYQKTISESAPTEEPIASQHPEWFQQQKKLLTPDRAWNKNLPATHRSIQPWISDLATQDESRSSFNELMDTPVDFAAFLMNQLKVHTLTPKLLAGPTYKLMKGSCKSLLELEFFLEKVYKATIDQFDWNNPIGQQYPHNLLKPLPLMFNSQGRRVIPFDHFINNNLEYLRGGASIHMLSLLVYGKMTNLTVEERFAFNVSLRMFTRRIVIQRRMEDLQLGVEIYQKKINLTKKDTYRSDLKHKEAYTAYSNPREFIYQNKNKQNRLMRIDELHKFSDGTLNDVRTALDDRLKGIRMKYLPHAIWRRSDKERAAAMI
nr:hypothetical protein [Tanacetum cinerariifolium]